MSSDAALLELRSVSASYGAIRALKGVDLEIRRGELVTLIGSNGAGKSTLLMSIFGHPRIDGGSIRFKGVDISAMDTHCISSLGISLVPEGRRIFAAMSVLDNLKMGLFARKRAGMRGAELQADAEQSLAEIFAVFPVLKERLHQRAGTLSGGEQQMLAIGRALMQKPSLLLLDEPSLGLAPILVRQIFSKLSEIAREGMTIFLVEQNANHALKLADRGYVLAGGEIRLSGSSAELLANSEVREAYLGH